MNRRNIIKSAAGAILGFLGWKAGEKMLPMGNKSEPKVVRCNWNEVPNTLAFTDMPARHDGNGIYYYDFDDFKTENGRWLQLRVVGDKYYIVCEQV